MFITLVYVSEGEFCKNKNKKKILPVLVCKSSVSLLVIWFSQVLKI